MAYTDEQKESCFKTIIEHIEKGNSLRSALRLDNMPSSQTFYLWLEEDELKSKQYARACEDRADAIFESILDIADDQEDDIITDKDGNEIVNHNVIQRARLRVDSRKWMLGKLQPKKYGDKIDVTSGGEVISQPQIHVSLNDKKLDLSTDD